MDPACIRRAATNFALPRVTPIATTPILELLNPREVSGPAAEGPSI
jgi:hypothetical protein